MPMFRLPIPVMAFVTAGLVACAASTPDDLGSSDATASAGDGLIAGTDVDATGDVPCSTGGGLPDETCPFSVQREGNGTGIVVITKPDGRTRSIFFERGTAIGYDVNEADPGAFSAAQQDDFTLVWIGAESYRIPDAVVTGD